MEQQEQRLKELAPAVRNMEQLVAQFSDDPERILPEPGPLESAKSYREKKAKPLLAKIVKVLRSLYRAYIDLKGKFERLQGDYDRVREGNARLSDRLQKVKLENKTLRGIAANYERVKRTFGPEEVERAVEDVKRQETTEKERRKAKRKFSLEGKVADIGRALQRAPFCFILASGYFYCYNNIMRIMNRNLKVS